MPTRPDLRDLAANVREAFADADRDTLLDVLTFVVKEYVVEGPPPMLMHQAETIADLAGLSFAQLITALQTRLDVPELGLFAVDGEQVSVRVGGVMQPLQAVRGAPQPDLPRPAAGVRVVETNLAQRAPAPPQPSSPGETARERTGQAPPPSRGLAVRGAPSEAPAAAAPAAPAPPAAAPEKKEEPGGDDAETRFGLLELD